MINTVEQMTNNFFCIDQNTRELRKLQNKINVISITCTHVQKRILMSSMLSTDEKVHSHAIERTERVVNSSFKTGSSGEF